MTKSSVTKQRAAAKSAAVSAIAKIWHAHGPVELPDSENLTVAEMSELFSFWSFEQTALEPLRHTPETVLPVLPPVLDLYERRSHNRVIGEVMVAALKRAYPELHLQVLQVRELKRDAELLDEIFEYVPAADRNN
jgi:hypothetical protein